MKHLIILLTLLLPTTANADIVKAPTCGIGMKCVSEQYSCPIKKPIKKPKKLYKAPKQTAIPVVEEKPCEIIQNIYYINEVVNNDYLGKIRSYPIDNVTRQDTHIDWGWSNSYWYGGIGYIGVVEHDVIKYLPISSPPIETPLPNSAYLLMSGMMLFLRRKV